MKCIILTTLNFKLLLYMKIKENKDHQEKCLDY